MWDFEIIGNEMSKLVRSEAMRQILTDNRVAGYVGGKPTKEQCVNAFNEFEKETGIKVVPLKGWDYD